MRVAHVNVAKNYRGGERQTELLIQELNAVGVEQVLVARQGSPLARRVAALGIEVRGVSGQLPGVVRGLRSVAIVHVHEGRSVYAAWLHHVLTGVPYVVTRRVNNPIRDHWFAHKAYRSAACVVSVAPQVEDVVKAFDDRIRTDVIMSSSSGLGSDPAAVAQIRAQVGSGFIVAHVGALDNSQKAQDVIIAAARSLRVSHPDIRFLLVGGGADEGMLHALAADLDNVVFTGFVENVGDYLAASDLFILPSRREGIGSILFDAMEHGLPLIATPVGGVPRIVHDGRNGLLIGVDDAAALAARIVELRSDPERMAAMGAVGREMARNHQPPQMARRYLGLYRSILDRE